MVPLVPESQTLKTFCGAAACQSRFKGPNPYGMRTPGFRVLELRVLNCKT